MLKVCGDPNSELNSSRDQRAKTENKTARKSELNFGSSFWDLPDYRTLIASNCSRKRETQLS